MKALYTGFENSSFLKNIAGHFSFEKISEDQLKEAEPDYFLEYDLLIIVAQYPGLNTVLQILHNKDQDLTPLIISDKEPVSQLKQNLLFVPFIGNNIIYSSADENEIKIAVEEGAKKTKQSRAFRQIKTSTQKIIPSISIPDNLKQVYLDKFFEDVPVGTILLDEQEQILTLNNYARFILKIDQPLEKIGGLYDFFPEELRDSLKDYLQLLPVNRTKVSKIIEIPDTDQYLEFSGSRFKHISQKEYFILTIEDITEKARAKQLLEQKIQNLEQMNEELERFAYIVSHDLKNPLVSLNRLCEMADIKKDVDLASILKMIKTSSGNLMQTVFGLEALIDINKNVDDQIQIVTLEEAFYQIKNELNFQLEEKGGRVSADFGLAPKIKYVKPYLVSIMTNLISNAVKYSSPESRLDIFVRSWKEKGYVVLSFKDNGIGIDLSKDYKKLFQPFVRLTNQATGKGVGLSLIKRMIEKNGGKIEVQSTPGIGTEFICYLKEY